MVGAYERMPQRQYIVERKSGEKRRTLGTVEDHSIRVGSGDRRIGIYCDRTVG